MLDKVNEAIVKERNGIDMLLKSIDKRHEDVLKIIAGCKGKVVFIGVGKSGHIGKKLAATFSSTGTPSFFVHATEAVHGDLGMIGKEDVAVLISNSGNTQEVVQDLNGLKKIGCVTIAFTANDNSELAKKCDYLLLYPNCGEADHLNLAPTVSSTTALVLGDALACALSEMKGFTREDFFRYHPKGELGAILKKEFDV